MGKINQDEGYCYGIGVFETMAVKQGKIVFPEQHLNRMRQGLKKLGIQEPDISSHFQAEQDSDWMKYDVKKVMVSAENVIVESAKNPYQQSDYDKGFRLEVSAVIRNETSPLTYIKSLNYGDNIIEKRRAKQQGFDEPIFFNSQGELTEGATTNIFFCINGVIYTPAVSCGLLPGIMRGWVMEQVPVKEVKIRPGDIAQVDEVFVTNSLLGIMPVDCVGEMKFSSRKISQELYNRYNQA